MIIFNFISFQIMWWLCVLSANQSQGWTVILLAMMLVCVHLQWVEHFDQALPIFLSATVGCVFDQLLFKFGYIHFSPEVSNGIFIPVWMIALWLAFATTLNSSLRWLQGKPLLSAILGGIFGPLAYFGAQALNAVQLTLPKQSLVIVSLEWALLLPFLLWIRLCFNHRLTLTAQTSAS